MKQLRLYSRPDCGLCERLLDELLAQLRGRAEVEVVDISEDDALEREYFFRIPVLKSADGTELSEYPLDVERVEYFLAA